MNKWQRTANENAAVYVAPNTVYNTKTETSYPLFTNESLYYINLQIIAT